jgi:spore germination cell wall hydrolase CwlJ-like protein
MIQTVRTAGFAAVVLGAALSFASATPGFAEKGLSMPALSAPVAGPRTLEEQVAASTTTVTDDAEQDCLASAVYFEARGEPLEGQLAVADVVMNRAASGRYPTSLCGVVEQPWQFSFVNATGRIPDANRSSEAWRKAVAIAKIAQAGKARAVASDVLWYHADYVSPSWGRRLARQEKIGLHIFYAQA